MWLCQCDCGSTTVAAAANLGKTTMSCGCLQSETASAQMRTHGMTKTTEFKIWQGMQQRCHNPNDTGYPNYGARGISVCERWRSDFRNFLFDMGKRPSRKHSIDRFPNRDGNYEPENCRWATSTEQTRNANYNRFVEIGGTTLCVTEWAERLGVNREKFYNMVKWNKRSGVASVDEAVRVLYRKHHAAT